MKIYDCFIFFNEIELLELRLITLNNIVDYFVIVESDSTFTGIAKEYIFEKNMKLFKKYFSKIIYVKVKSKNNEDAWQNEHQQRNAILSALRNIERDDYIMISDVDEIPNPIELYNAIYIKKLPMFVMEQKLTYYYVNYLQNEKWHGTVVLKGKYMKRPQFVRDNIRRFTPHIVKNGGWHYSFLGGIDRIKSKLESYSETQTNSSEINNDEHITKCLEVGGDLFFRDDDKRYIKNFVSLKEMGHPELSQWLKKYPNMIKKERPLSFKEKISKFIKWK